jgi:HlyD family secretion protein
MKKIFNTKKKIALGVVLVLAVIFFGRRAFVGPELVTHTVARGDFTQTVVISGKVVPKLETDLSFEVSGEVSSVLARPGDRVTKGTILAVLIKDEISNEIAEYAAVLDSERSKLDGLSGSGENQLNNNKQELLSTLKKAYVTSDDIVRNKIDVFFENPDGRFPEIDNSLSNYFLRKNINEQRYNVGEAVIEWKEKQNDWTIASVSSADAAYAIQQLKVLEQLLATISSGSSEFSATGGKTQGQIDAYITTVSQSRSTVSGLIVELNQIVESVRGVASEIPVQQAKVQSAQSTLYKIAAKNEKYIIRAPFDGVVTQIDIEAGEIASVGEPVVFMMGETGLEIETFIPEVRIVGIRVDNLGTATLDAFGEGRAFDVKIAHIDPRETEKDGITTYRTLIDFVTPNEDIKPGMTADIQIVKKSLSNVLTVPSHFVKYENGQASVMVSRDGEVAAQSIVVADKDGKGAIVVESGLNEGDVIVAE